MKKALIFLVLGFLVVESKAYTEFHGKVSNIIDGNTIEVVDKEGESYKIQLLSVDCPELNQQFGEEAKKFTAKLIKNKKVFVKVKSKDRWGNKLAEVIFSKDKVLNEILVQEGYAWYNAREAKNQKLSNFEAVAKRRHIGLWEGNDPMPPWIFRRQQTMLMPKGR